jgi:hypothetical protein
MTSRTQLAAEIDRIDAEITALQADKKEIFAASREERGKAECKAAQAAIKRRQKYADGKREEIEEHDELVDEIFTEIYSGTDDAIARSALRTKAEAPSAKQGASVGGAEYSVSEASRPNAPGPHGAASVAREKIADRSIAHPVDPASSPGTEADADPRTNSEFSAAELTAETVHEQLSANESHEGRDDDRGATANQGGDHEDAHSVPVDPIRRHQSPTESREGVEDRDIPIASEADAGEQSSETAASFSLADAKLISRVTAAKRKGVPIGEAGDSARFTRLVKEGALRLASGRLFVPAFAPEEEFA